MVGGLMTASAALKDADTIEEVHQENLTLQFQQAGEQIQDPEIKAYDELLLEGISPFLANPDKTGLERYLPDIEGVYHESLTTPFGQAGQQIEDHELKTAYDRITGGLDN